MYPKSLQELIERFRLLPGVGEKTAERYALAVTEMEDLDAREFATALVNVKEKLTRCRICGNLSETEECDICSDNTRNKKLIFVVQSAKDVLAMEKTNEFNGVYHVLNGLISSSRGMMPEDLNVDALLKRAKDAEEVIYEYDKMNRVTKVLRKDKAETAEIIEEYEYDAYGNCTRMVRNGKVTEYTYNVLDQIIAKRVRTGNEWKETSYTYDKSGRLIRTEGEENTERLYDVCGNLTSVRTDKGELVLTNNSLGYVVSESDKNGSRQLAVDFSRSHNNILALYDGDKCKEFIWDGRLAAEISDEEKHTYLTDEKGSINKALSKDSDWLDMTDSVEYDSYGAAVNGDPETLPFGYTGLYNNKAAGTWRTGSREYDPVSGRFMARDKDIYMRDHRPETLNLYQYCYGNPVIWIDPDGTDCYIFYLPEWKNEAVNDRRQLAKQYGYDESKVHLVPIKDNDDFTSGWNAMGTENGHSVDIDTVLINTHGNPTGLGDNRHFGMSSWDMRQLDSKDAENVILLGCNSGHTDYSDHNVAAELARKVDGAPVLASDGTVYSGLTFFNLTNRSYTSKNDKHFRGYRPAGSKRDNEGWVVYQEKDGKVTNTSLNDKKMNVTDMVKNLRKYPKRTGHCGSASSSGSGSGGMGFSGGGGGGGGGGVR